MAMRPPSRPPAASSGGRPRLQPRDEGRRPAPTDDLASAALSTGPPQPRPAGSAAAQRKKSVAKSIAWSDASMNPTAYTFLREPTPPPSPSIGPPPEYPMGDHREKNLGQGGILAPHMMPLPAGFGYGSSQESWSDRGSRRVWGIKTKIFWGVVTGIAILFVACAIGIGVGVGLTRTRSAEGLSSGSSAGSSATNPPATPTSPTSDAPSATSTASLIPTDCPEVNGTIYHVPGSDRTFLRLCGIDYSGTFEAVDIANKPTSTFADCMNNCAGTVGCTGCGWGYVKGDTAKEHRCWMKNTLQKSHSVRTDWCFGILQFP